MTRRKALRTILFVALGGLLFSGFLSYQELFAGGCKISFMQCSSSFSLFRLPACVYGFFMYMTIVIVSLWGLLCEDKKEKLRLS